MRDFTISNYKRLLCEIKTEKYEFVTFEHYLSVAETGGKKIILRHDVDRKPWRSLEMARIENEMGIKGTFFFRTKKDGFSDEVIREVSGLGHEIGYHYEDLDAAGGHMETALRFFQENLALLRKIAPVRTICMHGNPLSRHDNRKIWAFHDYKDLGIIGEPYFDVDYSQVLYLTDTGRRWDGERVSVRDKVDSRQKAEGGGSEAKKRPKLHATQDIMKAIRNNRLPDQIMLTIHPQRWTDEWGPWLWEWASQRAKNIVKFFMAK